ncbi:hypothetical protein CVU37_05560 [candidate division BRC1 bacterium HGW-BRC1-1]|nr:MAG: hypothetical protein CVU37_05560 [candidate division BRC1 bacterium HGW-BRC1-1]
MRAEVKKRVLICLGVGLVLEAVLGLFAWAVLSRGDPPLDPIEALAMLTQLPAWLILRVVASWFDPRSALVASFVLQSLFYAALCYAALHLLARGKRKQIIWALVSLGLGMTLEAILLIPMMGFNDHNVNYLLAVLMGLTQFPSVWIFRGLLFGLVRLFPWVSFSVLSWAPLLVLQGLFFAALCYAVIALLARRRRKKT